MKRIPDTAKKNEIIELILVLLISLSLSFFYSQNFLGYDNFAYAVEEMHQFDNKIFAGNVSVIGSEFSPRYYANVFMSFLIKLLGSSWFEAAAFLIRINYVLYAIMITYLTFKLLKSNRLLGSLILGNCIMCGQSLVSLSFGLNGAPDVFLGTGMAFGFMSVVAAIGENKNWTFAWIFAAIAGFLHVHEGIWAGLVIGIIWLTTSIVDKKIVWKELIGIALYIAAMLIVVSPNLLHSEPVDEDYFNRIYIFRPSQHMLLSVWGKRQIIVSILLLLFPAYIIFTKLRKNKEIRNRKNILAVTIALAILYCLLLLVEYLSTEVFPISFIVTMYVPKCFKYIVFLGIITYIKFGFLFLEQNRFVQSISLLCIPLVPNLATSNGSFLIVLCLAGIYIVFEKFNVEEKLIVSKEYERSAVFRTLTYLFIILFVNYHIEIQTTKAILIYFAIILYEFIAPYIKLKRLVVLAVSFLLVVSCAYSVDDKVFEISRENVKYIDGVTYVKNGIGEPTYSLALQFKNITDENVEFLADPESAYGNYVQLISQRSCYCLRKNLPSSKNAVIEWYERIERVREMTTCSAERLKDLLGEIKLEYVLVTADRFETIEESELFDVVVKNDELAMYKLK